MQSKFSFLHPIYKTYLAKKYTDFKHYTVLKVKYFLYCIDNEKIMFDFMDK